MRIIAVIFAVCLCGYANAEPVVFPVFPWKAGDKAPAIAGVHLGDSKELIEKKLGQPAAVKNLNGNSVIMSYPARGVSIAWASADGAAILFLESSLAGDIGGIRLGDSKEDVLSRWGSPSTLNEATAIYQAGSWGVVVRFGSCDCVEQLYVGNIVH